MCWRRWRQEVLNFDEKKGRFTISKFHLFLRRKALTHNLFVDSWRAYHFPTKSIHATFAFWCHCCCTAGEHPRQNKKRGPHSVQDCPNSLCGQKSFQITNNILSGSPFPRWKSGEGVKSAASFLLATWALLILVTSLFCFFCLPICVFFLPENLWGTNSKWFEFEFLGLKTSFWTLVYTDC